MHIDQAYSVKGVSVLELQEEIRATWRDLSQDSIRSEDLAKAGIDVKALSAAESEAPIKIERQGGGFDFTPIIVSFAPAAAAIIMDVWKRLILPRIRRKWGEDSIWERNEK